MEKCLVLPLGSQNVWWDKYLEKWQEHHSCCMPSDLVSLMQNVQQPAALRMAAWLAWSCCNLDYFVAYYHSNLKQACSGLVAYSALDDLKWAWEVVQGQVMKKAGADMGSQACSYLETLSCMECFSQVSPPSPRPDNTTQDSISDMLHMREYLAQCLELVTSRVFRCSGTGSQSSPFQASNTQVAVFAPVADMANHSFSPTADVLCDLEKQQVGLWMRPAAVARARRSQVLIDLTSSTLTVDDTASRPSSKLSSDLPSIQQSQNTQDKDGTVATEPVKVANAISECMESLIPVYISYGSTLDNVQLAVRYGFVISNNPNDKLDWPEGMNAQAVCAGLPHVTLLADAAEKVCLDPELLTLGADRLAVYAVMASIVAATAGVGPVMRPQASQLQGPLAGLKEAVRMYEEAERKLKAMPVADGRATSQQVSNHQACSMSDMKTLDSAVGPLVQYCQEQAKLFRVAHMLVGTLCK